VPTIFTRIIDGEIPGHFVWRDDRVVAFMAKDPLRTGHTLVVPRAEVDHWLDAEPELMAHVFDVARSVGKALEHVYRPEKVGLMLAGLEVPHTHLHVVPIDGVHDLDFGRAQRDAPAEALAAAAADITAALEELGLAPS
jgi:histidine triad (HIT) family protein